MRLELIAAAVTIAALATPATAMASGGGGGATPGGLGSAEHGATGRTSTTVLAFGTGYGLAGGSPQVRVLQRRLFAAGFAPGPVDGLYGPRTASAVARFQTASGLAADGIAGPRTLAALTPPMATVYPGAGYDGGSRLVRHLQRLLAQAGYSPGRIDGVYGPQTEHAVRQFQATHRLPSDGIAHPQTFISLVTAHRSTRPSAKNPAPAVPHPSDAPAPVIAGRPQQPSGASPVAWLAILGAALAALGLMVAALYTSSHRGRRRAATRSRGVAGHTVATSNGHQSGAIVATPSGLPGPRGNATENGADAEEAFKAGVLCEEQNDMIGAEAAYRRADAEGHAAAASNLGVLLERRRDLAGAEAAYGRADERGEPNGSFNLAMLLEERSDLTGAEAAYRRADAEGHAAAASNLGVLLERRRDLAGAEAAYRRADERGDPNGSFNLAVLLEERSDLTGAEAAYRRADERGPAEVANAARAALLTLRTSDGESHDGESHTRKARGRDRKDVRVG
jgi:peptidoglycan hydrolase-like protein with peptidoglycan-binding domain